MCYKSEKDPAFTFVGAFYHSYLKINPYTYKRNETKYMRIASVICLLVKLEEF